MSSQKFQSHTSTRAASIKECHGSSILVFEEVRLAILLGVTRVDLSRFGMVGVDDG